MTRVKLARGVGALLVLVWLGSGIYTVAPEEQAVVKRFGRVVARAVPSGVHYRVPWPVESHEKFRTTTAYKMGVGMITRDFLRGIPSPEELSLWLTGDTNILSMKMMIQYTVVDLPGYLYRSEEAQFLMARIVEAELTALLGGMGVDDALTVSRPEITRVAREKTQARLDDLGVGISIGSMNLLSVDPPSQVLDVFRDVSNASADRERIINEATGYANSVLPRARGEATWTLERAHGVADARVAQAEGEMGRLDAVREEYRHNPDATRRRLYLETLEVVLPRVKRYVLDRGAEGPNFGLRIIDLPQER
ncbi:MAG: FtsH protease activity modulator HflK [Gemmatimonadota bacterium]|jgi:membrane protease subunit HflK|nr:FtsH protease activity modulator HflK [Gemmatimonadota bacterium]MDP6529225.1 FtsH protease activity modulator HflK [Gemmatimonadota bacterium]MDP6802886.1 FtsH protease activity modulator HflK [Gemmatimonadota bacterium]MDP7031444.1 FtsH protease activity modulator HflK [Gemmatimonadota bacterium]